MPNFSPEALARIRQRHQAIKERSSGGGSRSWIYLNGKNAIVQPGQDLIVRFLPKWDFFEKRYRREGKKLIEVADYRPDEPYFYAMEHWWQNAAGKWQRDWCLRSFDREALCPLCEVADGYKASDNEAEQALGKRMAAKELYLYNAIVRARQYGDDGRPAIKILPVSTTLWVAINKNAGGEEEGFSVGDYTDWREGYDWKIHRPAEQKEGQKREEYSADCAKAPTPLYKAEEKDRWVGWQTMLHDLSAEVVLKEYAALYTEVYGVAPSETPVRNRPGSADDFPADMTGEDPNGGAGDAADPEGPPPDDDGGSTDFDFPEGAEAEAPPSPTPAPTRAAAPTAPAARRPAQPLRPVPGRRR